MGQLQVRDPASMESYPWPSRCGKISYDADFVRAAEGDPRRRSEVVVCDESRNRRQDGSGDGVVSGPGEGLRPRACR
jgi:hypothetical protein